MKRVDVEQSHIVNEGQNPQLESSILSLNFKIRKHHVHNSRIMVKCLATIPQAGYKRHNLKEIFVKNGHVAENLATHHHYGSGASSQKYQSRLMVMALVALMMKVA